VAVTLAGVVLMAAALSMSGPPSASAAATNGACADGNGVTVVVDFTEFGGSVETGCAPSDAPSGRAALLAAGFVATNSEQGLICAIDAEPDPCPATFDGSFWSYWHSAGNGGWTSYQVGADASHPVSGELEGWRYNDGATGPGIAPSEAIAATQPAAAATPPLPAAPLRAADTAEPAIGAPLFLGSAAVVILVILLLVARSRRQRATGGE
jgi:hypothetical protein